MKYDIVGRCLVALLRSFYLFYFSINLCVHFPEIFVFVWYDKPSNLHTSRCVPINTISFACALFVLLTILIDFVNDLIGFKKWQAIQLLFNFLLCVTLFLDWYLRWNVHEMDIFVYCFKYVSGEFSSPLTFVFYGSLEIFCKVEETKRDQKYGKFFNNLLLKLWKKTITFKHKNVLEKFFLYTRPNNA